MTKLMILGTANAIPDEAHENTHLAVVGKRGITLIDCASNPILRLKQAGLDHNDLIDIILTHFHPDHVSGFPLLLMGMGLLKRQSPLNVLGINHTINRMKKLLEFYESETWYEFELTFNRVPHEEMTLIKETEEYRVFSSPVRHFIPAIGLRFEFHRSGKVVVYSSDTSPSPMVVRLAKDADLLIHEAAGVSIGHSSASQAGEVAQQARVRELLLIHYPTHSDPERMKAEAAESYDGPVDLARDLMSLEF